MCPACSGQLSCVNGTCGCSGSTLQCGTSCCSASSSPPNQKPFCNNSGVCANQCIGTTLTCDSGTPLCGSWDFESNTVEGWQGVAAFDLNAFFGDIAVTTARSSKGTHSLRIGFNPGDGGGNGDSTGALSAEIDFCSINLGSRLVSVDVYVETLAIDPLNGPGGGVTLSVGSNSSNPVYSLGQWFTLTASGTAGSTSIIVGVTLVGLYNIYIDNVRIQ
jgi:hypothetical protein